MHVHECYHGLCLSNTATTIFKLRGTCRSTFDGAFYQDAVDRGAVGLAARYILRGYSWSYHPVAPSLALEREH